MGVSTLGRPKMGKTTNGWARDHDRCRACGTTDLSHRAKGLCGRCYSEADNQRLKKPDTRRGRRRDRLTSRITAEELRELYVEQELSLQEIADGYGCTRVMILYLMKRHQIPRRSHSEARRNAQRDGKVKYTRQLVTGERRVIRLRCTSINEHFFRGWSPGMAYVLGVFYTDGCLHMSGTGYYTATIAQKESELLEKCLALMQCDAPISYCSNPTGGIHRIAINHQDVCRDLIALGLHPRKSLTLGFPDAPSGVLRHFIRGCWDGDGSIYQSGNGPSAWNTKFDSGSLALIEGIHDSVVSLGMRPATIHRDNRHKSAFYVRWAGTHCARLYHILYDGVPDSQYLLRKYVRFRAAAVENGSQVARNSPPTTRP
jgi:hypothetical protein